MTVIGTMMRDVREDTGETLRSVARAVGISAPFLSDLENGRRSASADVVLRLATHYGINREGVLNAWRTERIDALNDAMDREIQRALKNAAPSKSGDCGGDERSKKRKTR